MERNRTELRRTDEDRVVRIDGRVPAQEKRRKVAALAWRAGNGEDVRREGVGEAFSKRKPRFRGLGPIPSVLLVRRFRPGHPTTNHQIRGGLLRNRER